MIKKIGSHKMTVFYPNPCYKAVCYKGTVLYCVVLRCYSDIVHIIQRHLSYNLRCFTCKSKDIFYIIQDVSFVNQSIYPTIQDASM